MTQLLKIRAGHIEPLPPRGVLPAQTHIFDQPSIFAINAALASRRPLLVRGEPGIGKSQLARAAARCLKRPYLELVVDARTEARDLLWSYDAVARLAEAQLGNPLKLSNEELAERLAVGRYVRPGPLWWALNWAAARKHPGCLDAPACDADEDHRNGCVLLIDEIDKAESEVPNGLLEALGNGRFVPFGAEQAVDADGPPPLVIITTNEERALPDAFLRRCLVLVLTLPESDKDLQAHLVLRGKAHFDAADPEVLAEAARQLITDRHAAEARQWRPLPGQAEYLDLVRAVLHLAAEPAEQKTLLGTIKHYVLQKHLGTPV